MSAYRAQVADALAAVRVRGSTSYAWMGRTCRALPATLTAEMDDAERRDFLVSCLREELYASFYCHARAVPARWGEPQPSATDRRLAAALSAANCGRGAWQDGWTVERVDGNEASVARPGLRVRAPLSQCRGTGNGVVVGAAIALRVPKDLPARSPGFFSVVGDVAEDDPFEAVVRVYWNIGPAAAPELVRLLSAALNARGVPFRLKVADHPMRFDRCDAAVLYLPASRFAGVRDQLAAIASTLARALGPRIPAFTFGLAPGVGLAEEAGGALSFGQRRCALLADAVVLAHARGVVAPAERLDLVAERFGQDGVSLDAPYREPALDGRHVL